MTALDDYSGSRDDREDQIVDMQSHFDVDGAMEELANKRFAMPPVVVAAFRQAAMKGAQRLLNLVENDAQFEKMRVSDQLRVLEMVFDRAYGKNETASTAMLASAKVGGEGKSDHSTQLDEIANRAAARAAEGRSGSASSRLSGALSASPFPELRNTKPRENVVTLPRRPAI